MTVPPTPGMPPGPPGHGGRGWPVASLDPIGRARVLAATVPSAAWTEGVLDAPYDATWAWVSDLERSVPLFDTDVRRLRVTSRSDEADALRLRVVATSFGIPVPFDVRLEDGFCLMRAVARIFLVVMAAVPEDGGQRTRFFHMEAVPLPGTASVRRRLQRAVEADFANLSRIAADL